MGEHECMFLRGRVVVGRSRSDNDARRVYVSLSKEQAQALPEFNDSMLAYVLAGVQELRNLKSFETKIETEDKAIAQRRSGSHDCSGSTPDFGTGLGTCRTRR